MKPVREVTKFWRRNDMGPVDLLRAHYVTHSFTPHVHEGYALGVIDGGAESFAYRGNTHVAPAGSIVLVNPDTVHTGQAAVSEGWVYRMMYFGVETAARAFPRLAGTPFFPEPVVFDPELAARFRHLHQVLEGPSLRIERETLFLSVMGDLFRFYGRALPPAREPGARPERLHRVFTHLREHFTEDLALEELAQVANMSPWHLHRSFRKSFGLPPHGFLINLKLRRARYLLELGQRPASVAQEVGFADQSHLSRHFKRVYGVGPGAFTDAVSRSHED